jgi:hypothetical protein
VEGRWPVAVRIAEAAAIAHQAASLDVLTEWKDRGQRIAGRQGRELLHVPAVEGTIAEK